MNVHKKLAAVVAAVLPITGLGVLGAVQPASATVPSAAVTCTNVAPDAAPPSGGLGGTTFDNAAGDASPGSNGVYFHSNPGSATTHSAVTLGAAISKNATTAELTTKAGSALAIRGQFISIAGASGTYNVLYSATPPGKTFPDFVSFTPALTLVSPTATSLKLGTAVTINDTPNPTVPVHVVQTTETNNSDELVGGFTSADAGQQVRVSYLSGGVWTDSINFGLSASPLSGGSLTAGTYTYTMVIFNPSDVAVAAETISTTVPTGATDGIQLSWTLPSDFTTAGYTFSLYGRTLVPNGLAQMIPQTSTGVSPSAFDSGAAFSPGPAPPVFSSSIESVDGSGDAFLQQPITGPSGAAVATVGRNDVAPSAVYTDQDYTLFGGAGANSMGSCFNNLGNSFGNFAPAAGTLIGSTTTAKSNSYTGLSQNPSSFTGTVTWPNASPGWLDNNGQIADSDPITSAFSFTNPKYNLTPAPDAYTFAGGSVTGEYHVAAAAKVGFMTTGVVTCTVAQLEAMDGTGPDSNPTSPYYISPAEAAGAQPEYNYCDGGPHNAAGVSAATALTSVEVAQFDPTANVYGSDGTPLAAIWWIGSGPQGNAVF